VPGQYPEITRYLFLSFSPSAHPVHRSSPDVGRVKFGWASKKKLLLQILNFRCCWLWEKVNETSRITSRMGVYCAMKIQATQKHRRTPFHDNNPFCAYRSRPSGSHRRVHVEVQDWDALESLWNKEVTAHPVFA